MFEDCLKNTTDICKNIVIPKPNDFKSFPLEVFRADSVFLFLHRLLVTIKLNDAFSFQTRNQQHNVRSVVAFVTYIQAILLNEEATRVSFQFLLDFVLICEQ